MAQIPDLDAIAASEASKFRSGTLNSNTPGSSDNMALLLHNCMMEAMRQVLELAAEKAELEQEIQDPSKKYKLIDAENLGYEYNIANGPYVTSIKVRKQSITGVIDLVRK